MSHGDKINIWIEIESDTKAIPKKIWEKSSLKNMFKVKKNNWIMLEQTKNWEVGVKMNHLKACSKQEKQPTLVSISLKPWSMRIRLVYNLIWEAPIPFQITHFLRESGQVLVWPWMTKIRANSAYPILDQFLISSKVSSQKF